ncbi:DUF6457 domain-containing protein [Arthrobacter sp. Br18]|uniref:DUF6457 domain-containing protein n=1 Tax=Arthrobacter sp. Br18 TaxID=1312954 RepID=UPI0004B14EBE|nr:DUF6457 domain-containing protein [Arthrobacter sp. Br18]
MTVNIDAEEHELSEWSRKLTQALQILDLEVDHGKIVEVVERSRSVSPNAGAISAFLVGYAAGSSPTRGRRGSDAAVQKASKTVLEIATQNPDDGQEKAGWTGSAQ